MTAGRFEASCETRAEEWVVELSCIGYGQYENPSPDGRIMIIGLNGKQKRMTSSLSLGSTSSWPSSNQPLEGYGRYAK
jgi:hypothetical protein